MKKTPADFKDKDFWIFSFQEFKPQFIENIQAIEDAKEMEQDDILAVLYTIDKKGDFAL